MIQEHLRDVRAVVIGCGEKRGVPVLAETHVEHLDYLSPCVDVSSLLHQKFSRITTVTASRTMQGRVARLRRNIVMSRKLMKEKVW